MPPLRHLVLTGLLGLLASVAVRAAEAKPSPRRFLVTEQGAKPDGTTVNTAAIQATIDRCAADGGGMVVVPAGTFRTGAIFFKQGVNLLVEKDGVLKGTSNPDDYPQVKTRWEGTEREWISALVNFFDLTDLSLSGEGMIDGSGDEWVTRNPRRRTPPATAPATDAATPPPAPVPPPATASTPTAAPPVPRRGSPRLIALQNCQRVRVSGLKLKNQATWGLFMVYCEDVLAENLFIRADHNIPSSDGIDIDSSRRVRVTGCDIDVNDDCISIKSGKDADGLRVNRPSENILIEHTRFGYGHGGVAMGSETSGGIRNVEVRDCIAEDGNWAPIRFKTQPSRGGVVENIVYRNFQLRDVRQAVEFTLEWRMVPPIAPPAKVLPVMRNISLINLTGTATSLGSIHGLKDSPITGVTFERCDLTATRGLVLQHTRDIDVSGSRFTVKEGEPVVVRADE